MKEDWYVIELRNALITIILIGGVGIAMRLI